jgi:hypothetical protein
MAALTVGEYAILGGTWKLIFSRSPHLFWISAASLIFRKVPATFGEAVMKEGSGRRYKNGPPEQWQVSG